MKKVRAAALHEKLWRFRREASYGWLAGMQIIEEVAETVAPDKNNLTDKIPLLTQWLNSTAQDSAERAACGMGIGTLLDRIRYARNGAVHRGTASQRLEEDIEAALRIIEEALTVTADDATVGYYMIPDVLEAKPDDTLISVRDRMLRYDISAVPVEDGGAWQWITATDIARYRTEGGKMTEEARALCGKRPVRIVQKGTMAATAAKLMTNGEPALLVGEGKRIDGIVTAFDLLYANRK